MTTIAHHWSDNDRYFWRFTYAKDSSKTAEIMLSSGSEDYPGCSLRIRFFGHTVIIALPSIISEHKEKVTAVFWAEETIKRLGRNWYWQTEPRDFGFSTSDGYLYLRFGRQTGNSSTEKSIGYFLPWTQWRFIATNYYTPEGKLLLGKADIPKVSFLFKDYDKDQIEVQCFIEERRWLFGTGWFKWLSFFRKPRIVRTVDLRFSKEIGPEKGSWKGGTLGHGIEIAVGETIESAFRRYCDRHMLTFIGPC